MESSGREVGWRGQGAGQSQGYSPVMHPNWVGGYGVHLIVMLYKSTTQTLFSMCQSLCDKNGKVREKCPDLSHGVTSSHRPSRGESCTQKAELVLPVGWGESQKLRHLRGRENLPEGRWVSQVVASRSREGRGGLESVPGLVTWG